MGYTIVGKQEFHSCSLPKVPSIFHPKQRRAFIGTIVKCDCGRKWIWKYLYDSQGGCYNWSAYNPDGMYY